MATNDFTPFSEVELLHSFLGARLDNGQREDSVEKALADFSEYRRQLNELRATLREAETQSARGESKPLDLDALFARVDQRLERDGIPE